MSSATTTWLEYKPAEHRAFATPMFGTTYLFLGELPGFRVGTTLFGARLMVSDRFCCEVCGCENHADVVGAINVSQGEILPIAPPKRIRKRVGKRKPLEVKHAG
jgi:hypothetical protein